MPLGLVSKEIMEKELKIPDSTPEEKKEEPPKEVEPEDEQCSAIVKDRVPLGRGEGNKEVPDFLRKIIGESSVEDGRANTLLAFGGLVSPSSVTAYTNGATSCATYNKPDKELKETVDNARERIRSKAEYGVLSALEQITTEKLGFSKPKELASIAKDLSAVIRNMEEKTGNEETKNNVQIVFMAPREKSIDSYPTIEVVE